MGEFIWVIYTLGVAFFILRLGGYAPGRIRLFIEQALGPGFFLALELGDPKALHIHRLYLNFFYIGLCLSPFWWPLMLLLWWARRRHRRGCEAEVKKLYDPVQQVLRPVKRAIRGFDYRANLALSLTWIISRLPGRMKLSSPELLLEPRPEVQHLVQETAAFAKLVSAELEKLPWKQQFMGPTHLQMIELILALYHEKAGAEAPEYAEPPWLNAWMTGYEPQALYWDICPRFMR